MENKEKNFVSAVIYVHNAEMRVGNFLKNIIDVLEDHFEHSEIICVDDSSTDESCSRIKEAGQSAGSTSLSIVHMSYFHGLEAAMNAGVDLAIGDFVFEFDDTVLDFEKEMVMQVYQRSPFRTAESVFRRGCFIIYSTALRIRHSRCTRKAFGSSADA